MNTYHTPLSTSLDHEDGDGGLENSPVIRFTLADVIAASTSRPARSKGDRSSEISALHTLQQATGRNPDAICLSGSDSQFEHLLRHLDKSRRPLKARHIKNLRARCRSAFRRYRTSLGIIPPSSAAPAVWPPEWHKIRDAFPKTTGFSPVRFISFAVGRGWRPFDIGAPHFDRYAASLADLKHPRPHLNRLIAGWNAVTADPALKLTPLAKLGSQRRVGAVKGTDLDAALQKDIAAYFAARAPGRRVSIRDSNRIPVLKQASVEKAGRLIRQFIGLLRDAGVDITTMRSFADVVTLDHVGCVTTIELDRTDDQPSSQLRNMLTTFCAIARHWTRMPETDLAKLSAWVREHTPDYDGMVDKNRKRLMKLKDPRNRKMLLGLPAKLMSLAAQSDSERGAYLAQSAVAIELLLQTAMRVGNLAQLTFDEHVVDAGSGASSKVFILVPAKDVKNNEAISTELPTIAAEMLRIYRKKYLHRLRGEHGLHLFPGSRRSDKGAAALSTQIRSVIKEHTGLDINAHLFRSFAVMLLLESNSGNLLIGQRVLGDRSLATITKHYAFIDEIDVRAIHQAVVADARDQLTRRSRIDGHRGAAR